MASQREDAEVLAAIVTHPGWGIVERMAADQVAEYRGEIINLMESKPDQLTGKTAIAKANRARGVEDFIESVRDVVRLLERK